MTKNLHWTCYLVSLLILCMWKITWNSCELAFSWYETSTFFPLNVRKGKQTFVFPASVIWEVINSVSHPFLFVLLISKERKGGEWEQLRERKGSAKLPFLGSYNPLEEVGCLCNHSLRQLNACPEQKWRHKGIQMLMGLSWSWEKTSECLNVEISCLGSSTDKKVK